MEWILFGIAIVVRLLIIWWCVSTARRKGRDTTLAGVLGFFFGLWAAIGYAIVSNKNEAPVYCPYCGESTTIRKVQKGEYKGKRFHVCDNYPKCIGRVKV